MDNREKISDVFKAVGQPTVTYVKRDNGKLERILNDSLNERGQLCLVTGPSKTGKTTLYREVLKSRNEVPLVVACDRTKKCDGIWREVLETVDFDRVESRSRVVQSNLAGEVEIAGKLGWSWLAQATSRFKGSLSRGSSDTEARKTILSDPGPDLLIPLLRQTNYILVIEDFHYLEEKEKVLLFQQWKRFIDNEVSVLVLGTTHRAIDIANSNRDLIGRSSQVDVGHWDPDDLEKICVQGLDYLGAAIHPSLRKLVASEAVGLPIVVQQVCQNMFTAKGVEYIDDKNVDRIRFERSDVEICLHNVARQKYTQFESYYSTLIRGPREKSRKYKTYELVLACFTLDPIKFSLKRIEIDERMRRLQLADGEVPPAASLNSTLGALKKFQERRGFDLLEWSQSEEILYIIEPSFLYYVRWRALRSTKPTQLDLFEQLVFRTRGGEGDKLIVLEFKKMGEEKER